MGEGSTEFFESEEDIGTDKALIIKAKPGRAVIFPSNMLHRGVTSTNGDRIAINCVFSEKK
jgi:predicted 2-oxoglutarate/Fe(II)-dependent dioxygenase YbiX